MRKKLFILILLVIFGFLGFKIYSTSRAQIITGDSNELINLNKPKEIRKDYATLTFAGDVMLDRGVKSSVNKNFGGDFNQLFKNVELFKNDDISFLNLEGPVSDMGHKVGSIYSFRMPVETIPTLKNTGVDIVSFANNHVGDYTAAAFTDTMERLLQHEISWTGAGYYYDDATTVRILEVNDIKIGFIGFSDVGPEWMKATEKNAGILLASDPNFIEIIKTAKEKTDVLVVSFHWGEEYKEFNTRQKSLAEKAIDNGADIIVGHHPHVPQEITHYKEKPIIYSLGNFMFDQNFSTATMGGLVVQVEVKKDGRTQKLTRYKTTQNKTFQIESIAEIK